MSPMFEFVRCRRLWLIVLSHRMRMIWSCSSSCAEINSWAWAVGLDDSDGDDDDDGGGD